MIVFWFCVLHWSSICVDRERLRRLKWSVLSVEGRGGHGK